MHGTWWGAGVVVAAVGGAVWQRLCERRDSDGYRCPGRVIRVGDASVHVVVEGEGDPTIVIESGIGGSHLEWEQVAAGLRPAVRVVRYDRPGFAFSPYARGDRRPEAVATVLREVLAAERIPPPYLLVGHSLGGLHVRAYAALFPQEVAGAVLVDPAHEDVGELVLARPAGRAVGWAFRMAAILAPMGMARVLGRMLTRADARRVADARASHVAAFLETAGALTHRTVGGWRGLAAEYAGLVDTHVRVGELALAHGFPAVPLTVISAGRQSPNRFERVGWTLLRTELHGRIAALSPYGRHVVAEHSGHMVPLDEPEVVVDEVRAMHRRLRAR